jgi:hypothetical protein
MPATSWCGEESMNAAIEGFRHGLADADMVPH